MADPELLENINKLLITYLKGKANHYDILLHDIQTAYDLQAKYNPPEYIQYGELFDMVTEFERENIKRYVTRAEVTQFSELLDTLLSGNIDLKYDTLLKTINANSFDSLQKYFTEQQGITRNIVGTVYYDIIGKQKFDIKKNNT